ncbi:MAG: hypothetical protein ACREMQ_16070 [Longimicrobiales bacterium]
MSFGTFVSFLLIVGLSFLIGMVVFATHSEAEIDRLFAVFLTAASAGQGFVMLRWYRRRREAGRIVVPGEPGRNRRWLLVATGFIAIAMTSQSIHMLFGQSPELLDILSLLFFWSTIAVSTFSSIAPSGLTEWGVLQFGPSVSWTDVESFGWKRFDEVDVLVLELVRPQLLQRKIQVRLAPGEIERAHELLKGRTPFMGTELIRSGNGGPERVSPCEQEIQPAS